MIFAPVIRHSAYLPGLRITDRQLERFLGQTLQQAPARRGEQPARFEQTEQDFTLELDVPGLSREQLQVELGSNTVRIDSVADAPRRYQAAYELPQDLDPSTSSARLENGVLTLKLSKKAPVALHTRLNID
ncbi:Hsp20/alpha crystallin family protein [Curvibacter sp. RS43]|jgi:HSP20 family protein|uniref:Hsp20/alpha crystallin family protein n=1 Tax=Curvibacter microcysteis TaxID=3026419 RepID=UPI00236082A7|nr:Hsp20/alpha crystallin family protein [Curvibacter sp. RS43]MDD0812648.1 Hsp20/alpha crystallin family protein [Curvibacter sp. RS43]